MKITLIECHILIAPDLKADATSSSQDNVVVIVRTDSEIFGIGEADSSPWLVKAAIEGQGSHTMSLGIRDLIIGMDPFDTSAIWEKLYTYTAMSGRRGAVICAIGAIDMALWDIKGKALNLPVYKLLGGAQKNHILPYASLLPNGRTIEEYKKSLVNWTVEAKQYGFKAAKLEVILGGPYYHGGLQGSDEDLTEIITACREAIGTDFDLMVDVGYLWRDVKSCLRTIRKWENLDIYFLETPLLMDNIEGYAFLSQATDIRIAAGEWQNTRFEFIELMDRGRIDVAQPDIGRVGGLTEAMRVACLAQDRGKLIVPHCWKTGIGIAASAHFAAAIPNCPFIEYLPGELCESVLRKELIQEPLIMKEGKLLLPEKAGLGIELNFDTIEKYSV